MPKIKNWRRRDTGKSKNEVWKSDVRKEDDVAIQVNSPYYFRGKKQNDWKVLLQNDDFRDDRLLKEFETKEEAMEFARSWMRSNPVPPNPITKVGQPSR